MHKLVFSLAILMGTVLVAQIPEEIPLEPPANQPNEVAVPDVAVSNEKAEILGPGQAVAPIDERPPVPTVEQVEVGELVEPDAPADTSVLANPNELVLPPKVEGAEIATDSN
ncbi:MAG: hypothetical protein MK364_10150, partial [Pirellulales bacterium]|nr:hypothetical protein [Pirellulales bacterium]